ncbi:aminotransferase class IV [Streptomyces sp. M10(2022)]
MITVPWTRNERSAVTGLKTTSHAENVVALARAHEHGASEAIFPNTVGQLCEGTGSNVFVVVDGQLHPAPHLRGSRRDHPGARRGMGGAQETELALEVLEHAEEIFLTSTLRDIQAVHRVDGRELPGCPGR